MNTFNPSKQRELSKGAVTQHSLRSRAARRPNRLLLAAAVVLAVTALGTSTAQAGVEFVTPIGRCDRKVDQIGDGKDLFIIAGNNVRFEVWGNSVDGSAGRGFRIGVDSGSGTVTARIIRERSGSENDSRCGLNTGSAEVEVDSPVDIASDIQRSLYFKMPLGDESRLQIRIRAYPQINVIWTDTTVGCIVKTGTIEKLNQDQKIRIQLPAGHQQDQTTCNQRTLSARVTPSVTLSDVELDIDKDRYSATGTPAFLQTTFPNAISPYIQMTITFNIDVAGIRALSAASNSNIVISSPNPNRSVTLNLEVIPDLGLGFSASATCNPSSLTAGNPTDCTLTLPSRLTDRQPITWRITTASCFTQAVPEAPYDPNAPFQVFNFPVGQSAANIRVRSVDNAGCTDRRAPINHVFEAWIGNFRADPQVTTVTSGPKYTRTNISLLKP